MNVPNYRKQLLTMVRRYLYGGASHQEKEFVEKLYDHFDQQPDILDQFTDEERQQLESEMHQHLLYRIAEPKSIPTTRIWQTTWFRLASAASVIFATGLYLSQSHIFESAPKQAISTVPDVGPGQNKAILTLSNGQSIALDASARGIVAQEGQMKITGSGNGELAYAHQGEGSQTATGNNTISTPAGGQYRVVLPDGSKVWLNAASSLNYPAVFTGPVRSVSVTGECYFEIAKDAGHPFIVQIADKQKITVLGTHFNVSAYTNDDQISTTLLEGSVKVSEHSRTAGNSGKEIRLMVGEQATMGKDGVFSKKDVDVNQAVAWKEGLFYFQNADVPTVLRQIERWYNVRVVYNAADYTEMFSGKIHRDANLSQMLEILRFSGLDFKLQSSGDKSLNGELVLTSARD